MHICLEGWAFSQTAGPRILKAAVKRLKSSHLGYSRAEMEVPTTVEWLHEAISQDYMSGILRKLLNTVILKSMR